MALLQLKNLTVSVTDEGEEKNLVNDVSLSVESNRIVALVGGSGSGKTTTGLSILRLLPPALSVKKGEIIFGGKDLLGYTESAMQKLRGKEIGMVFQEPLYAFNPLFTIGYQIAEVLKTHTDLSANKIVDKVLELLQMVEISDPKRVASSYPYQLSGGMRQRAMLAQAIAASPKLIIADEPTSNLDVTLQARIMQLFRRLKDKLNLSILLITHDLGVVRHLTDEVVVLAQGKVIESGPAAQILANPKEEFTQRLVKIGL